MWGWRKIEPHTMAADFSVDAVNISLEALCLNTPGLSIFEDASSTIWNDLNVRNIATCRGASRTNHEVHLQTRNHLVANDSFLCLIEVDNLDLW
jgi:hypothetical protein